MLSGANERWNKTLLPMAIAAGRMFFYKLSGVRISMARLALVGLPNQNGEAGGVWNFWFVACFAGVVSMRRFQRKPKCGMKNRVDPSAAKGPTLVRRNMTSLAVLLSNYFKAMRAFVAVDAGGAFHSTEPHSALLMAVRAGDSGVRTFQ